MNRAYMLQQLQQTAEWDVVIIGGGATGLGTALDAAARGYRTLLLEQADFGKGTSSRSTKLVHGGVRYLAQGNVKLVMEALKERGRLLKNAPHLTFVQPFIVPAYRWWEKYYYAIGLRMYDLLSGSWSLGKTKVLNKETTLQWLPSVRSRQLSGGILYYDGQFDDSRLCVELAFTAARQQAILLNYCKVMQLEHEKGKITGLSFIDQISGTTYRVKAKSVVNATGVFTDSILQLDDAHRHKIVTPSQGIHLVVAADVFPGKAAMMIPKTDDGRVLFAVPWMGKVLLGTTDTPVQEIELEPKPLEAETTYIIEHFNRYSSKPITKEQVLSVYAGLRPLVTQEGNGNTAMLSRDHTLIISPSGLVTITGGKWTTYRKMAQDAVDNAAFVGKLTKQVCPTKTMPIGDPQHKAEKTKSWIQENEAYAAHLHPDYPYTRADLKYALQHELAVTVEDILARRTRLLFLDARVAVQAAPRVASWMAAETGQNQQWEEEQVKSFELVARHYIIN
ncbi:MAG: glycerol-3-phosphate dehydrogenase/oxidase [Chitinophagaceae bacterium]|nr:glycerol-3-phosphate dehydrogenase/oxidase [Chitinophagaceae bacterium]